MVGDILSMALGRYVFRRPRGFFRLPRGHVAKHNAADQW